MELLLILIYSLLFIFLLYLLAVFFFTKVPIVLTNKKYFPIIFAEVPVSEGSIVYELGCGLADFLFFAEKYGPKKLIGYELSPLHVVLANLKAKIIGSKIKVYWQDFFNADISEADYIYLFLVPKIVDRAWLKITKEAKKGAFVLVLSDNIPYEKPFKVFKTQPNNNKSTLVRVYQVK
jgi:SAM-dependent methyltransferase